MSERGALPAQLEVSQVMPAASPPPLDAVVFRLAPTIERDLEVRAVLPELRRAKAMTVSEGASVHHLTPGTAQAVLQDALACAKSAPGSLKVTYAGHAANLRAAMDEAASRVEAFQAPAAVSTCRNNAWDIWRGTRSHLEEIGICLRGPWPTEPGGRRWAVARDAGGRRTVLKPAFPMWPGLFEARIDIASKARTVAPRAVSKRRVARAAEPGVNQAKWEWRPDGGRQLRAPGVQAP